MASTLLKSHAPNLYARDYRPVTPKLMRPKIGLTGPILAENFAKTGPRITFAAKFCPTRPILAAKTCSPSPILVPL